MTAAAGLPAFIGVGSSVIERRSERGMLALAMDAAVAAVRDAGLEPDEIDGYVGAPSVSGGAELHVDGADELSMRLAVDKLGLRNIRWGADLHSDFVTSMAVVAGHALHSGACRYVLGIRAMSNLDAWLGGAKAGVRHAIGRQEFELPFGAGTTGSRFALRAQAYLHRAGADRRALFDIVDLLRRNARRNPLAIWRDNGFDLDRYMAAPMVASPLCLFDCDMPVYGAAAFVMTLGERAATGPHRPVYIAGSSAWTCPETIFDAASIPRENVSLCQLYDGFSSMMWEWLERLGWCESDTAWRFFRDGHGEVGGRLPINTFGGSIGEGRLHGAGHLREAILQLSGRAGERQVANAEHCLVQVGPHDYSSMLMLSAQPRAGR